MTDRWYFLKVVPMEDFPDLFIFVSCQDNVTVVAQIKDWKQEKNS